MGQYAKVKKKKSKA